MRKIIFSVAMFYVIVFALVMLSRNFFISKNENNSVSTSSIVYENNIEEVTVVLDPEPREKEIDDWRLTLVNYENPLPEDYEYQLTNIDNTRKFDSRAIDELRQMLNDIKKSGIKNVWVQSAYRSVEYQTNLFNNKIDTYMKQGKTREEAEELTLQVINRPGTSEHNLGLSVDFNNVNNNFDQLKGFKWLQENAENYGFVLRYKKEKEDITKITYEPWHWRYVGVEHAKKMNELDMCLEEYVEYLKNN